MADSFAALRQETGAVPSHLAQVSPGLFVALWSTGFVAARYATRDAGPLTFLALRLGVAGVILAAVAAAIHAPRPSRRAFGWALLAGTVPSREALLPPLSLLARPQRGRRLAVALALSCVALFAITPSFAPPAADVAATRATAPGGLGQTAFREQTPGAFGPVTPGTLSLLLAHSDAGGGPSLSPAVWGMDAGSQDMRAPIPYAPPQVDVGAEPLGDPAVAGYIALADYHSR